MIELLLLALGSAALWRWVIDPARDRCPPSGAPPDVSPPLGMHDLAEADPELLDDLPDDCDVCDDFDELA